MPTQSALPIDEQYFRNYAGSGESYQRAWRDHSFAEECIAQFKAPGAPRIRKVCVLGAATGLILKDFDRHLGVRAAGCEISKWAHSKIPQPYRRRIRCQDMRDYVAGCIERGRRFDLVYSNSLVYLEPRDLRKFLKSLSQVTDYLHFNSSFKGKACPDPYRRILESYAWWNEHMVRAGFEELRSSGGKRTFLWRRK